MRKIFGTFAAYFLTAFFLISSAWAGPTNTVMGPVSPEKLGSTLVHEHFIFNYPGWYADASIAPYNRDEAYKVCMEVIKTAQAAGINTIIDATPNDAALRDPELFKELSEKTGFNIIVSTGLYTEHGGAPGYFKERVVFGKDISKMMAELFIKEITEGIGKSGVKAGVIKVGSGPKMTDYEKAVHKAAAVAQKATGVPIITHTEGPTGGLEQADFLIAAGADPKKIMIGHVSNSKDINYHKAILARGVNIGFDRLGLTLLTDDKAAVKNIAELCKTGYAGKIMLSHDTCNFWPGRPLTADLPPAVAKALANWKVDYISKNILPALKAEGVTDEQIQQMLVGNPQKLFAE